MGDRKDINALHIHDAANVGKNLVEKANELGRRWSTTKIPWYYKKQWTGPLKHPALRARPLVWDGTLAIYSLRYDVAHLHTGGLSPHMRWVRKPWVLHLHGTDIRTRQYDAWKSKIEFGMKHASAVVYATPDLAEHVEKHRADAIYLPITVRLDQAPTWQPVPNRVIFASRWEEVKGMEMMLEVARLIREARPNVEMWGLDWGPGAADARAAGVSLVPKKSYEDYKNWLATASVVVGQMTDVLATSELEALASGVPLVSSARQDYYPELVRLSGPEPAEVASGALMALDDPQQASAKQDAKSFIAQVHDAEAGVKALSGIYASIIAQED
ncbi:glycosyltransferase [Arthrobacter crusticola]|uniref:Glycosyltransferase n=1 Tax=Arthrobacter crusticola TaxID=2547960 RepID=A0A4R5TWR0_9MICC|nr:glycosyltransferase family 4 protein [Arthrobacter crusticola]TDK25597.1 glycosyltransferase [Arthrobacter crusticola]